MAELLEIKNLSVSFETKYGVQEAVKDVSLSLFPGEVLAIVGESGSGKSVLCKSIMKLLPRNAHIKSDGIKLCGVDIANYSERSMRPLRGSVFSMIFQDSATALNPAITVGRQIGEAIKIHNPKMNKKTVESRVYELMERVELRNVRQLYKAYPWELSGGMRQRIAIAIALATNPKILFADEATTALDVTVQAQILDLLVGIQKEFGLSTIFVSHDLGVVARIADRVAVMHNGEIVEIGTTDEIFENPQHPYTRLLLSSIPSVHPKANSELKGEQ